MGRRFGQRCASGSTPARCSGRCFPPGECIRATALGASEYSVQLSGNTSTITNPGALLPRRNLQVLQPPYVCEETIDPDKFAAAIRRTSRRSTWSMAKLNRACAALARRALA